MHPLGTVVHKAKYSVGPQYREAFLLDIGEREDLERVLRGHPQDLSVSADRMATYGNSIARFLPGALPGETLSEFKFGTFYLLHRSDQFWKAVYRLKGKEGVVLDTTLGFNFSPIGDQGGVLSVYPAMNLSWAFPIKDRDTMTLHAEDLHGKPLRRLGLQYMGENYNGGLVSLATPMMGEGFNFAPVSFVTILANSMDHITRHVTEEELRELSLLMKAQSEGVERMPGYGEAVDLAKELAGEAIEREYDRMQNEIIRRVKKIPMRGALAA